MPEEDMFPPDTDRPWAGPYGNNPDRWGEKGIQIPMSGVVFLFPEGWTLIDRKLPVHDTGGKRHTV
jgi:hypothetical protein